MTAQSTRVRPYSLAASTATWFPAATALTGTLTSTGCKVVGVGTAFKTTIKPGDYLVRDSDNTARKVVEIIDDTNLRLEVAFSSDLAAEACLRVMNQTCREVKVMFFTNSGTIKDADQDTAVTWAAGYEYRTPSSLEGYMMPICVTAGAGGGNATETI